MENISSLKKLDSLLVNRGLEPECDSGGELREEDENPIELVQASLNPSYKDILQKKTSPIFSSAKRGKYFGKNSGGGRG